MKTKPFKKSKKPYWHLMCEAYEEAAEHLEMCAAEECNPAQKYAYMMVASRIRSASNRVQPNDESHED